MMSSVCWWTVSKVADRLRMERIRNRNSPSRDRLFSLSRIGLLKARKIQRIVLVYEKNDRFLVACVQSYVRMQFVI